MVSNLTSSDIFITTSAEEFVKKAMSFYIMNNIDLGDDALNLAKRIFTLTDHEEGELSCHFVLKLSSLEKTQWANDKFLFRAIEEIND